MKHVKQLCHDIRHFSRTGVDQRSEHLEFPHTSWRFTDHLSSRGFACADAVGNICRSSTSSWIPFSQNHCLAETKLLPIGSMVLLYMVCHGSHQYTPFMLVYIYTITMDPMGYIMFLHILYNLSVGYLLAASTGSTDDLIPLDPGYPWISWIRIQKQPSAMILSASLWL